MIEWYHEFYLINHTGVSDAFCEAFRDNKMFKVYFFLHMYTLQLAVASTPYLSFYNTPFNPYGLISIFTSYLFSLCMM